MDHKVTIAFIPSKTKASIESNHCITTIQTNFVAIQVFSKNCKRRNKSKTNIGL